MKGISGFINKNKISMLTFVIVGGLTAIVNFGVFGILWNLIHLNYQLAVSMAYLAAITFHFNVNRIFTFKGKGTSIIPQLKKYLTVTLGNYFITIIIVKITVEIVHQSPYLGIVYSVIATMCTGYLAGKFWIFKTATLQEG